MAKYIIGLLFCLIGVTHLYAMEADDNRDAKRRKIAEDKVAFTQTKPGERFFEASEYGLNIRLNLNQKALLAEDREMQELAQQIQNELPLPLMHEKMETRSEWIELLDECSDSKKLPLRSKLLFYLYNNLIAKHPQYGLKCPLCLTHLQHLGSTVSSEAEGVMKRHPLNPSCIKKLLTAGLEAEEDEMIIQNPEEQEAIILDNNTTNDLDAIPNALDEFVIIESLVGFRRN